MKLKIVTKISIVLKPVTRNIIPRTGLHFGLSKLGIKLATKHPMEAVLIIPNQIHLTR